MTAFKKLSGSRLSFTLTIPEEAIKKSHKKTIDQFRKHVAVKGFRKGHAPEEVVISSVGLERISFDAMNRAVDEAYQQFIATHKLRPIQVPKVDVKDFKKKPLEVEVEVEVYPEIELGDYKKIKIEKLKVEVTDQEVEDVLETLMTDAKLGKEVKREAKKKDLVTVDFAGKDKKGDIIPNTEGKNHPFRLGFNHFLEDLEKGIEGMKIGEEKEVKVKFPKDYHGKDLAGNTIPFTVKLHKVEEISAKNITDADVAKITGENQSVKEFKEQIKTIITGNKTKTERKKKQEEYSEKFLKYVKADLPESWVIGEVESRLENLKSSPQYQHDPENFWKAVGKTEEALKKEFHSQAEQDLKVFLGLNLLVEQEKVELGKEEIMKISQRLKKMNHEEAERHLEKAMIDAKIDKFLDGIIL
jgi:trigger factor